MRVTLEIDGWHKDINITEHCFQEGVVTVTVRKPLSLYAVEYECDGMVAEVSTVLRFVYQGHKFGYNPLFVYDGH